MPVHQHHGGEGAGFSQCREAGGWCAIEGQIVGEDQLARLADAPAVAQAGVGHRLVAGLAAKHHTLDGEKLGIGGKLGLNVTHQRGAIEQDRLLRQPDE